MRAGLRMAQERADFIRHLRREDVLELAGLLLDFIFILHLQGLRKQPLRKPVPPNHVRGALPACRSEIDNKLAVML